MQPHKSGANMKRFYRHEKGGKTSVLGPWLRRKQNEIVIKIHFAERDTNLIAKRKCRGTILTPRLARLRNQLVFCALE